MLKMTMRVLALAVAATIAFGVASGSSASAQTEQECTELRTALITSVFPDGYGTREVLTSQTTAVVVPCSDPDDPDDVLEELVVSPPPAMAVTGSNVEMPLAVGLSMIGIGGLAVIVARKRENANAEQTPS